MIYYNYLSNNRIFPHEYLLLEDQDAVAVVAQMLWACQADLVALVGLPSLRAVPKICALLSLWDQSNGTGKGMAGT